MPSTHLATQFRDNWTTESVSRKAVKSFQDWQTRHAELGQYDTPLDVTNAIRTSDPIQANRLLSILLVEMRNGCVLARDAALASVIGLAAYTSNRYRQSDSAQDDTAELVAACLEMFSKIPTDHEWPLSYLFNTLRTKALHRQKMNLRRQDLISSAPMITDVADSRSASNAGEELLVFLATAVRIGAVNVDDATLVASKALMDQPVGHIATAHGITARAMQKRHGVVVGRLADASNDIRSAIVDIAELAS